MKNPKTVGELQSEIAYFKARLKQTTSKDRRQRARAAIRLRERLLRAAFVRLLV